MDSELDVESHINSELPCYRIAQCPQLGRYLVAARDIKKGEVVLNDQPLAVGPIRASPITCPGCFQDPCTSCDLCGWPICSLNCSRLKFHKVTECKILRDKKAWNPLDPKNDWDKFADCLMVVRCLLLKRTDPKKWRRLLEMETNWERWSQSPLFRAAEGLLQFIRSEYNLLPEEFSSKDILTVLAILDINAYEVRLPEANIQAAYQLASLAEHNCTPNTHKTINSSTYELTFRAAADIPQGTHISTTYCDILWPSWHRQQYLQWSKFFICSCIRCRSPSELDSHLSSLICVDCTIKSEPIFKKIPALPIISEWDKIMKDYQCTSCLLTYPARDCHLISKKADDELSELDKYASLETLPTFEAWLSKWTLLEGTPSLSDKSALGLGRQDDDRGDGKEEEQINLQRKARRTCYPYTGVRVLLHPQHSLVLDCCHTLFLIYPKEDCSLQQLRRKEQLGTHLLSATSSLFAGISKFRGTISYELALTKATILVHQLEQSGLTDNLQELAQEVLQLLTESREMLKFEPADQPEGKLAQTGANQLQRFTAFFAELFPKT